MFRKENLPYKRAREKGISAFERVQDKVRTGVFRTGELFLANCDDRSNCGGELSMGNDLSGATLDPLHVSFNFALVCLEPDVLQSARNVFDATRPHRSDAMREDMKNKPHLSIGLSETGLEAGGFKVYSALLDLNFTADVVLGVMGLQGVQTTGVADTFAHPIQLLLGRGVR
jgi:hypothetical protein